mmetsp:Transcript_53156/g.104056  ORF Transcript_53156/g.104056 Transcript_53156/m.104056 type:complete len:432 (+) Transcript_53156:151-1446(+)
MTRDCKKTSTWHSAWLVLSVLSCGSLPRVIAGNDPQYMPAAKRLCHEMDAKICVQWHWDDYEKWTKQMAEYFSEKDFVYDFSSPDSPYVGIAAWWGGEHIPWNKAFPNTTFAAGSGFIEAGGEELHTVTTYATAAMQADFKGIPHRHRGTGERLNVTLVDLDFYKVGMNGEGKFRILYNACMVDLYSLMVQAGYRLLDSPSMGGLVEGSYWPPRTMAGVPAPNSQFVKHSETATSEGFFDKFLSALFEGSAVGSAVETFESFSTRMERFLHTDAILYANPLGIGRAQGREQALELLFEMFVHNFSARKLEREADNFVRVCEGLLCGVHGYQSGAQIEPWLGAGPVAVSRLSARIDLRFALHVNLYVQSRGVGIDTLSEGAVALDLYLLFDIPHAVKQMGRDLFAEIAQLRQEEEESTNRNWEVGFEPELVS